MVEWGNVNRNHVLESIREYDRLGPQAFFSQHGFSYSKSYELVLRGRRYPHKAILGRAYELATGRRLHPGDFEGGKAGAVRVLGDLGFAIEPRA
jgi:hypothetical protein